jgi:hypothetical protein
MGYAITWTLRNIPTYTRDQAIRLTGLTGERMAGVVAIAIDEYYHVVIEQLKKRELERERGDAS